MQARPVAAPARTQGPDKRSRARADLSSTDAERKTARLQYNQTLPPEECNGNEAPAEEGEYGNAFEQGYYGPQDYGYDQDQGYDQGGYDQSYDQPWHAAEATWDGYAPDQFYGAHHPGKHIPFKREVVDQGYDANYDNYGYDYDGDGYDGDYDGDYDDQGQPVEQNA